MIRTCLGGEKYERFLQTGDADSAAQLPGCGRFRVNAFRQSRGSTLVLRVINAATPELSALHLPESIRKILTYKDGLVLVTGPTGSGKSTTLAAILNEINKTRSEHIITIEDPIEYLHVPKRCLIDQREIGTDSVSYAQALRAALREDPDILLVGEMRDLESISIAITAAETGHLVLSTLHTSGAARTIDRLIDVFPPEQQQQIRTQLSLVLRSVVSQHLLPTADGRGRAAAFEIMFVNNAISNLIREGKTANIAQMIQTGAGSGMITLENSLQDLLQQGMVSREAAAEYLGGSGSRLR
jgi:twitching motility protein PilT